LWVPLSTGCSDREDTYVFRSALGPGIVLTMGDFEKDTSKHFSVDWLRTMLDQLNTVRPYFLGDFYPLLSFSIAEDAWAAWQYDRPDLGEGMILVLRRAQSPFAAITAPLHGLVPDAQYELRDLDTGETSTVPGAELMQKGCTITIQQNPGSKLVVYKKK
jgi:alpha-galactosidase